MPTVFSKHPRGIALLEGVIAIGVIIAGVVGSLVLVNTSIRLGRANQDKIVAQNLAREGVELAYGLRNSGSLRNVDDPLVDWSSYIFTKPLKANNPDEFLTKYNLGDVTVNGCRQRHNSIDYPSPHYTTENNDQDPNNHTTLVSNGEDTMQCDLLVLVNHLFNGWPMPPACAGDDSDASRLNLGTQNNGIDNCDYNGDGATYPNIVDITTFLNLVYQQSFQFGYAYPSITAAAGTSADARFNFYSPITGVDSLTGLYTSNPPPVWDDARAQVYTYQGAYVQPDMPLIPDDQPTKFYRVVNMQPICRGTKSGVAAETVIDTSSAFNCKDYVATLSPAWDAGVKNVGALVTSEVRWPTAASATKVRYQEFLYDWISL